MDREKPSRLFDITGRVVVMTGGTGGIDVVVNKAATALAQPVGEYTFDAWARSLDKNLRGPVFLVQAALPHLKKSKHAAVLKILSGAAFFLSARVSLYALGKAGLIPSTRAMEDDDRAVFGFHRGARDELVELRP